MTAVQGAAPAMACIPVAFTGDSELVDRRSGLMVPKEDAGAYRRVGAALNERGIELLCVQHEYGIFGGCDGAFLLELLDVANMPLTVTLHTVLDQPTSNQRQVMQALLHRAAHVFVMTDRSARVLAEVHGVGSDKVSVVPHGIPPPLTESRESSRRAQCVQGRQALLTFGLLSPGKGIEHVIRALPRLAARWPDILYVVIGATHPNLLRDEGEAYRERLANLAASLRVDANVRFVNRFVELPELLQSLNATDIYVTPYLNVEQSVSGTLSYSYGTGTPVVSTPYHHAAELLADGRGVLVPFADPAAIADAVTALLDDPSRIESMRQAGRLDGQRMLWPAVGARYVEVFRKVVSEAAMPVA